MGPACLVVWLHNRVWVAAMRDKGDLHLRLCLSRERKQLQAPVEAAHQRQLGSLSVADLSREPAQGPFASALPISGARVLVWGEGKTHT